MQMDVIFLADVERNIEGSVEGVTFVCMRGMYEHVRCV